MDFRSIADTMPSAAWAAAGAIVTELLASQGKMEEDARVGAPVDRLKMQGLFASSYRKALRPEVICSHDYASHSPDWCRLILQQTRKRIIAMDFAPWGTPLRWGKFSFGEISGISNGEITQNVLEYFADDHHLLSHSRGGFSGMRSS
jgi:hypothetical protein